MDDFLSEIYYVRIFEGEAKGTRERHRRRREEGKFKEHNTPRDWSYNQRQSKQRKKVFARCWRQGWEGENSTIFHVKINTFRFKSFFSVLFVEWENIFIVPRMLTEGAEGDGHVLRCRRIEMEVWCWFWVAECTDWFTSFPGSYLHAIRDPTLKYLFLRFKSPKLDFQLPPTTEPFLSNE